MDAAFCLGAAPPHSSLFQMSGVLTAIGATSLFTAASAKVGFPLLPIPGSPDDRGWTAIDPNRSEPWFFGLGPTIVVARSDRRRDDVGGQHPGDLILRY